MNNLPWGEEARQHECSYVQNFRQIRELDMLKGEQMVQNDMGDMVKDENI